jgi:hypothetical protein
MNEIASIITNVCIYLVAIKAILGYHFPWERCECCGKKWREHIFIRKV